MFCLDQNLFLHCFYFSDRINLSPLIHSNSVYNQAERLSKGMDTYYLSDLDSNFELIDGDSFESQEYKQPPSQSQEIKSKNKGHWNYFEKELYFIFLREHRKNFIIKQNRRIDKIFKVMSKFIKTRGADQCRSHHQKMQKKFRTIDAILESKIEEDLLAVAKIQQIAFQNSKSSNLSQQKFYNHQLVESKIQIEQFKEERFDGSLMSFEALEKIEENVRSYDFFSMQIQNINNDFLM